MAGKRCLERSIFGNTVSQERQFVDKLGIENWPGLDPIYQIESSTAE